ncbi:protein tyrosine phosphatase type IVA 2-like isoform X1 [Limulus polyphemus]|uniref:Protein tyrosine phosphatase type IVA 2-like isoform X1 n=1 Tax=Limulus polyphemus TaxID=6850 RepID=A0ABM1B1Z8_LIMPO|nr:protein tyrosine phosphatase type IVA 2-like isoform X1 [Limulus polyphemus]XP_013773165.1 protein tyrosine phosphatase type IVA 2-like isoform X1 [Limulus polyphemus]
MSIMKRKGIRPAPSEISYKNMRFLILDRPSDSTFPDFLEVLKKNNVKDLVRVCEVTYKTDLLDQEGIVVHDWQFEDGTPPPADIVDGWFNLLRTRFRENPESCVAVHCVAGLGRAPVLVALALIELGMKYEDAVELIRQKRRGAINSKQLTYLKKYRPKYSLKTKNNHKQCNIQ